LQRVEAGGIERDNLAIQHEGFGRLDAQWFKEINELVKGKTTA
jgi:hypothetical protein